MNDTAVVILVVLVLAIGVIYAAIALAGGLLIAFYYFVANIPLVLALLLFILFPPTLIAFLIGGVLTLFVETEPEETTPLESPPRAWAEVVEDSAEETTSLESSPEKNDLTKPKIG